MIIEGAATTPTSPEVASTSVARDGLSTATSAQLIDHLMIHEKLTLAQIAARSGVSSRTLEDIRYGRSSGARAQDAHLRVADEYKAATASRAAVRAEVDVRHAQEAAIAEGLIVQMEVAAQRAEQTEHLFAAACRFLGLSRQMTRFYERLGPIGVQTVIDRAYRDQTAQNVLLGHAYVQAQHSTAAVVAGTLVTSPTPSSASFLINSHRLTCRCHLPPSSRLPHRCARWVSRRSPLVRCRQLGRHSIARHGLSCAHGHASKTQREP